MKRHPILMKFGELKQIFDPVTIADQKLKF